jgi:transposase-like protein
VGRRGIKEYRAAEALALIAADRDHKALVCPSCNSTNVERTPKRSTAEAGRVSLHCAACGRSAVYLPGEESGATTPELPPPRLRER